MASCRIRLLESVETSTIDAKHEGSFFWYPCSSLIIYLLRSGPPTVSLVVYSLITVLAILFLVGISTFIHRCFSICIFVSILQSPTHVHDYRRSESNAHSSFIKSSMINRQRKKKVIEQPAKFDDLNPVYCLYYFTDGQQVDYNQAEVTDENQYYGS